MTLSEYLSKSGETLNEYLSRKKREEQGKTTLTDYISRTRAEVALTDLSDIFSTIEKGGYIDRGTIDSYKKRLDDYIGKYSKVYNQSSEDAKSYLENLKQLQKGINQYHDYAFSFDTDEAFEDYYKKTQLGKDLYDKATSAEDFNKYAGIGADIKNPTMKEVEGWMSVGKFRVGGKDVGNIVTYSRDHNAELRMGAANGTQLIGDARYSNLKDDEVSAYNYWLAKENEGTVAKGTAQSYLDAMDDTLNQREAGVMAESIDGKLGLSLVFGAAAGLSQFANGVKNLFDFKSDYIAPTLTEYASQKVRENLGDVGGEFLGSSAGQIAYDAVTTTANMLPTMMVSAITGGKAGSILGTSLMGLSAGGNYYKEFLNSGMSKGQARALSTALGVWEGASEHYLGSIEKISGNKIAEKLGKTAIIGNLKSSASGFTRALMRFFDGAVDVMQEGGEEVIQDIGSKVIKLAMTGEWEGVDLEEEAYNFTLGALTAGLMNTPINGIENTVNDITLYRNGRAIKNMGGVDALKNLAVETANEYKGNELVSRYAENVAKKPTAMNVGILDAKVNEVRNQNNLKSIENDLIEQMVEDGVKVKEAKKSAGKIAEILLQEYNGKSVDLEKALKNPSVKKVYDNVIKNKDSEINLRDKHHAEVRQGIVRDFVRGKIEKAEAEKALSSKFSSTENGKTINTNTGEEIRLASKEVVVSNESGKMTLRLEDGNTVSASDVGFSSKGEAVLFATIADMGVDTHIANSLLESVAGADSKNMISVAFGLRDAFWYGSKGVNYNELEGGVFTSKLTEQQRKTAYNLGKTDAIYATSKKAAPGRIMQGKVYQGEHKITNGRINDAKFKHLNDQQKSGLGLAKMLSKLGANVYVFESTSEQRKNGKKNGSYIFEDGSIHIDLNSGTIDGEGLVAYTVSHEFAHFIEDWSPDKFRKYAEVLFEELGHDGKTVSAMIEAELGRLEKVEESKEQKAKKEGKIYAKKGTKELRKIAYSEVVAKCSEKMFTDTDILQKIADRIAKTDKTLLQKIVDFFKSIIDRLRGDYDGQKANSHLGNEAIETIKRVEAIRDIFADAAVDALQNYKNATVDITSSEAKKAVDTEASEKQAQKVRYMERESLAEAAEKLETISDDEYQRDKQNYPFVLVMEHTPKKILNSMPGGKDRRILIRRDALYLAIRENGVQEGHYHALGSDVLKKLPEYLESPDVILSTIDKNTGEESKTRRIVLSHINGANGQGIVSVEFESLKDFEGSRNFYNIVVTVFDLHKNYLEGLFKKQGAVIKEQKESLAQLNPQLYEWLRSINAKLSSNSISPKNGIVNAFNQKNSDRYTYEELVSKPDMKVTVLGTTIPTNRADVIALAKENAIKVGKFNTKDGSVSVHVNDIDTDVVLSTNGLKHGLDRRFSENALVTLSAGEILQNTIQINELTPSKSEADRSYVLVGMAMEQNSRMCVVRFVVNRFRNELTSMDVLYAINAKKENPLRSMRPGIQPPVTDSTISIAQLLESVNRYFPDILPEDVLRHFGYSERPNGEIGKSALYSDREDISNRTLLANALETVAQNDIEKSKLKQYKAKIGLMEADEKRLSEIKAKVRELSFAKGHRNAERISNLQKTAKEIEGRINRYDKQLFHLEASDPLKKVLAREYEKAKKVEAKKYQESLDAYRKRSAETVRTIIQKNQESRKKAIEGRNKTEVRNKVKKVVSELNQYLKDNKVLIGMQKIVAEALDAINMDTVDADERVAKYDALIAKQTDPGMVEELIKTRDRIAQQGEHLNDKLQRLKTAYADIINSDDPLIANSHDEVIESKIDDVIQKVGNTSIRNMTLDQLEEVYDMYKMILTSVRQANKAFKMEKAESVAQLGDAVIGQVKDVGGYHDREVSKFRWLKKFGWKSLKPIYAMRMIGSDIFTELYQNIRNGEDSWYRDMAEAKAFKDEQYKKHGYSGWDFKKQYPFTSKSGKAFHMTLEQIMSLYAYSKRPQAIDHLIQGGIVFDSSIEVVEKKNGIPIKYNVNTATAFNLSEEIIAEIIGTLSEEQRAFVDEMQAYLSEVMAEKGNEVSLAMYGVKLFKEKVYFPLRSASQFMYQQNEVAGEVRIKNSGFSKSTVAHANNPILLNNFMDVWAGHCNNMAMYHSFVLPLEDFNRVWNYKTKTDDKVETMSVKQTLQDAYGAGVNEYISTLLTDLNGGARQSGAEEIGKMMSLAKKGAVFASASVTIQQPSAICRAMAYISPKYFAKNAIRAFNFRQHSSDWAECKRYAPVAGIKEMGYFDTGMGHSSVAWLKSEEYEGFRNKLSAFFKDGNYRDEILSKAPSLADELTWCFIWNATKSWVADTTTLEGEDLLTEAGKRFTEVITLTQVYDSVLSRSGLMRSKDTGTKMATAFMAEPTTTMNMVADAIVAGGRIGGKQGAEIVSRVTGAVVGSIVLNALLKSVVVAWRHTGDDDDETYIEKYGKAFIEDFLDNINPLTYIPFVKDIVSIFQGYTVDRMDMALFEDLANALKSIDSSSKSTYQKVTGIIGSVASFFGLPIKNIERDFRPLIKKIIDAFR